MAQPKEPAKEKAKQENKITYFTGKLCRHGHLSEKYVKNSQCCECVRLYVLNNHHDWAKRNIDKIRKNSRNWYIKNKEKAALNSSIQSHKRRSTEGKFTEEDIKALFYDQFNRCVGCGREFSEKLKYTIDHIVPISKGGTNWPENLQLLCGSCNYSKGSKCMEDWFLYRNKE